MNHINESFELAKSSKYAVKKRQTPEQFNVLHLLESISKLRNGIP